MLGPMVEYRVLYTRTASGPWSASVRGLRRCKARGRTLRQARARLRLAVMAAVGQAPDLLEDVRLPAPARDLLVRHWKARRRLLREQTRADEAARRAGEALAAQQVNLRDASDLLGIPAARLQALLRVAAGRRARA